MYLTGRHTPTDSCAHTVVMTCIHTKLTKLLMTSNRIIKSPTYAINALIAEVLYFDKASTVVAIAKVNQLRDSLFKEYKIDFRFYPAPSYKSLGLVEHRMRQMHNYIGKLTLSDSKISLADFSTFLNMSQNHISTPPLGIANINDVQVTKIENSKQKNLSTLSAPMTGLCFK